MTDELVVPFTGSRAAVAPLTWSQAGIWKLHRGLWPEHHYFNFGRLFAVPAGRSVDDVARAVGVLVSSHEAFRTTIHRNADGELEQRVVDRGEYRVAVVDAPAGEVAGVSERLAYEYKGHAFEDDERPLLIALITSGGVPAYVLFMASHLAVDRWGMDIACADFTALLADPSRLAAAESHQPVDQASAEAGPSGQRMARRAAEYWRRTLEVVPQNQFPWSPSKADGRWSPSAALSSRALGMAAQAVADRHGGSASTAVLAAVAGLLATRTGVSTVAMRLFASNRYAPQLRTMVGTCAQPALFAVDVAGLSAHGLVARAWHESVRAYKYSRYPPDAIDEVVAEVNQRRGIALDLSCHFHDATAGSQPFDLADIEQARQESRVRRDVVLGRHQQLLVELTGQVGGRLRLMIGADPRLLTSADLKALVCGVEELLVRALDEDVAVEQVAKDVGIVPQPYDKAVLIDGCWIEPGAVRHLLLSVPAVSAAEVEIVDGELVAHVTAPLTPAELHRLTLAQLVHRPTAMAPQRYVVRHGPGVELAGSGR